MLNIFLLLAMETYSRWGVIFYYHSCPVFPGRNHPWRVFETVKVVNKAVRLRSRCHSPGLPGSSPMSTRSSCTSTPRTSYYGSDNASLNLEDKPSLSNAQKEDNRCVFMHILALLYEICTYLVLLKNILTRSLSLGVAVHDFVT